MRTVVDLVRRTQLICSRKSFQERANVIGKFAITDASLLQNVPCEDVEIKLRRNAEMSGVAQNCFDQARMIEDRVERFCVTQERDE